MAATFNMLRSNDLIWSFVINNYLLGRDPFPFDLLHWNADSTRMPAKMHSFYLRNMYMKNALVEPGKVCSTACRSTSQGHRASYFASAIEDTSRLGRRPTTARRRCAQDALRAFGVGTHRGHDQPAHREQVRLLDQRQAPASPDAWLEGAQQHEARGGPTGARGLARTGPEVAPRVPGKGKLKVLCDAPAPTCASSRSGASREQGPRASLGDAT